MQNSSLDEPYDHEELIGLEVFTTDGDAIGPVTGVLSGAANDNLVVKGDNGDILIPFIGPVIMSIDLASRRITIEAIEGLLDLNVRKQK